MDLQTMPNIVCNHLSLDPNGLKSGRLFKESNQKNRVSGKVQSTKNNRFHKYEGDFMFGAYHGRGKHTFISNERQCITEGSFYVDTINGYSSVFEKGNLFEGLFKNYNRFGPGILTYEDDTQDVGLWVQYSLIRLAITIKKDWVPSLAKSPTAKVTLLRHRHLVDLRNILNDPAKDIMMSYTDKEELINRSDELYNKKARIDDGFLFPSKQFNDAVFNEDYMINVISPTTMENHPPDAYSAYSRYRDDSIESTFDNEFDDFQMKLQKLEKFLFFPDQCDCIYSSGDSFKVIQDQLNQERNNMIANFAKEDSFFIKDKITISHLLAWNNEEMLKDILKHSFQYRHDEGIIHFSVDKVLSGERFAFKFPGVHEKACINLLRECSNGNDKVLAKLILENNLNPDVCDAKGNTGMMFASARDRTKVIKKLTDYGANVDSLNDEGMSPLTMCILRYLAVKHNVCNWESAFIMKTTLKPNEQYYFNWTPATSYTALGLELSSPKEMVPGRQSSMFSFYSTVFDEVKSAHKAKEFFSEIQKKLNVAALDVENKDVQENYSYDYTILQPFILSTDIIIPPPPPKKKKKKGKKKNKKKKGSKSSKKSKSTKSSKKSKKTKGSKKAKDSMKKDKKGVEKKEVTLTPSTIAGIKPEPEEPTEEEILQAIMDSKLKVIMDTIKTLLQCGADPDISDVPLPAILLSIFTQNVDLLENILANNANPNIVSLNDEMTAIHVITCLPPCMEYIQMLNLLLNNDANPNLRTNMSHWQEENKTICKDFNEEESGKTPLHILAMRYDFIIDENDYLLEIADLLLKFKENVDDFYLGHTPLTLAMLRGNIKLINTLLEHHADPNILLGYNMGVPLTIYILKRFNKVQPVETCLEIMKMLVDSFANPLNIIDLDGNAIEFANKEHAEKDIKEKGKKRKGKKSGKKSKSSKSSKSSTKSKSSTSSKSSKKSKSSKSSKKSKNSRKSKKSKKGKKSKVDPQMVLRDELMTLGKDILLRNRRAKALRYLFEFIEEDDIDDDLSEYLAGFLTPKTALQTLKILVDAGEIAKSTDFPELCDNLLDFMVDCWPKKVPHEELNYTYRNYALLPPTVNIDSRMPELDKLDEKYNVCFYCLSGKGKELYLCPSCCLVYYCSQECNKKDIKKKSPHSCKVLFYNKEKQKHDNFLAKGGEYFPNQSLYEKHEKVQAKKKERYDLECAIREKQKSLQKMLGICPKNMIFIPGVSIKAFLSKLNKKKHLNKFAIEKLQKSFVHRDQITQQKLQAERKVDKRKFDKKYFEDFHPGSKVSFADMDISERSKESEEYDKAKYEKRSKKHKVSSRLADSEKELKKKLRKHKTGSISDIEDEDTGKQGRRRKVKAKDVRGQKKGKDLYEYDDEKEGVKRRRGRGRRSQKSDGISDYDEIEPQTRRKKGRGRRRGDRDSEEYDNEIEGSSRKGSGRKGRQKRLSEDGDESDERREKKAKSKDYVNVRGQRHRGRDMHDEDEDNSSSSKLRGKGRKRERGKTDKEDDDDYSEDLKKRKAKTNRSRSDGGRRQGKTKSKKLLSDSEIDVKKKKTSRFSSPYKSTVHQSTRRSRSVSTGRQNGQYAKKNIQRSNQDAIGREKMYQLQANFSKFTASRREKIEASDDYERRRPIKLKGLPNYYQCFLEMLVGCFPDVDMTLLLLPFACFVDGQLYYRFLDRKPNVLETYSSI